MRKLRLAHVRCKRLHDLAVRQLAHKTVERFLIFPDGNCPGFERPRLCFHRVSDQTGRCFQLALCLECVTKEVWQGPVMKQRQIRNQRQIFAAWFRLSKTDPRRSRHKGSISMSVDTQLNALRRTRDKDRWNATGRRNRYRWSGHPKTKSG